MCAGSLTQFTGRRHRDGGVAQSAIDAFSARVLRHVVHLVVEPSLRVTAFTRLSARTEDETFVSVEVMRELVGQATAVPVAGAEPFRRGRPAGPVAWTAWR